MIIHGISKIEYAPAEKTIIFKNKGKMYARPFYTKKNVPIPIVYKDVFINTPSVWAMPHDSSLFSPFAMQP
jgi:hypothetical protein